MQDGKTSQPDRDASAAKVSLPGPGPGGSAIIGQSPAILEMIAQIDRLADVPRPVLIVGERGSGKVLFSQPVTGSTLLIVGSDLTSAERQALPLLAADFAKNATAALADGKW